MEVLEKVFNTHFQDKYSLEMHISSPDGIIWENGRFKRKEPFKVKLANEDIYSPNITTEQYIEMRKKQTC